MKTKLIFSITVLALVMLTKSAFAEDEVTTTPKATRNQIRQEVRDEIREEKQEAKATITQVREEKKGKITELKLRSAEAVYKAIKMGLTKKYEAYLKIKAKLDARIVKNPMNKDTTKAADKLKGFVAIDDKYKADLLALDDIFNKINLPETKVSELITELKTSVEAVKKDLKDMKNLLKEATVLLAQAPKLSVTPTKTE